jgi:hypothetical protein
MSMIIRYKIVGGREGENCLATEADAWATLKKTLDEHVERGYSVKQYGDEFVVEDHAGDTVATYEIMH